MVLLLFVFGHIYPYRPSCSMKRSVYYYIVLIGRLAQTVGDQIGVASQMRACPNKIFQRALCANFKKPFHRSANDLKYLSLHFPDVSYNKNLRIHSLTLPTHLTLVGCYGSEEKLIDCNHHEYTSSTSVDVSITCSSSGDSNSKLQSMFVASQSTSVKTFFI